ncbi:hypothetical protein ACS0TY_019781 [Phlomoides rotata]
MSIGMVIHNDSGEFVACRSLVIPGIYKVEEGEAMRLLEALLWLKQLSLQRVQIEVDAKLVADAVNSKCEAVSVFNEFILKCKRETSDVPFVYVNFIYRDAIVKAHRIAQLARIFPNPYIWMSRSLVH